MKRNFAGTGLGKVAEALRLGFSGTVKQFMEHCGTSEAATEGALRSLEKSGVSRRVSMVMVPYTRFNRMQRATFWGPGHAAANVAAPPPRTVVERAIASRGPLADAWMGGRRHDLNAASPHTEGRA